MNLLLVLDATLHQVRNMLIKMDEKRYRQSLDIFSKSSIGQHCRHIIEFMQCLIAQYPEGSINYDKRVRNKSIENDPKVAIEIIDQILTELPKLKNSTPLILESNYSYGNKEAWMHTTTTTLDRELVYNIEHAIHHMAIIKIGLKEVAPEISIPEGFGVAPSTIRHRSLEEIEN